MGLDSVELLVTVERKFKIEIPNQESERINTVQEFVNSVFDKINIATINEESIKENVFLRLIKCLNQLGISCSPLDGNILIKDLFITSHLHDLWTRLQFSLELFLPALSDNDIDPNLDTHVKIFGFKTIKRNQPITSGTLNQLVDWIISINFESLINFNSISNLYEIERTICGLINRNIGIPINEIEMHHSINADLGID
ncbi:acyl carrier protein [Nonlabens xylanidelens]|uniref:Acyl carrier protein n=1 Tax=Nonlabens xylanidelens TaxID=191564 RepID=A0A2S6IEU0_9FLAO|nr:phosphopantetheine-binding protein [Nonlabens xylanidelens]PPK92719.1 acyl carrier protein [Nonlabens xylanidelens]PQJ19766.1 hypothetical protein BST94_05855 [Nonlabens xylanidelens]